MPKLPILTLTGAVLAAAWLFSISPKHPGFTILVAKAQETVPNSDVPVAETPQAEPLLLQSIRVLSSWQTVQGKLLVGVNLFGQQLVGSGTYCEQNPGMSDLLRWEINIQQGDTTSQLMRISDGHRFWESSKLAGHGNAKTLCYDRDRLRRALVGAGKNPQTDLDAWPLSGGTARLLRGLYRCFWFDKIESGRLDQVPVWRMEGRWRPTFLEQLIPEQKKAIRENGPVNLAKLPVHAPDLVVLFLGKDDLFPYRMECRRTEWPADSNESSDPDDMKSTIVTYLQLVDVKLNAPIDASQFQFSPGQQDYPDKTEDWMRQHNLKD